MITIYLKQYNKIIRNADTKLFDELGYDDILWIDMLLPTIKEQKAVENFMEISLQTKQQVEEIESTSKYSENENAIISNSNFFVPTGDTFIVEPVSFIISNEGVLVSVRSAEFRTFRETEKRLQMNYRSYSTGYHLFISLLEVRIDFDADLVELIAKQVAALSKDINSEDSIDKAVLHRISALQESTMSLRENIFDRQRVLSGILRSERFPNDIYPRLQLMIKDVNSLINHADFSFQRLDYIQDAALGLINIEQNEIVKIFSVAAVIFMPATLIASIYGMNFKFMPELDWTLQVAALSKDINSEDSIDKAVLHRISALQESTMSLRENIFDRQRVLSGILRSERFPNDIYPRLQLMIKDVNSLINHADFSFQRLDYIQDAALGLINIEQNEIVKIFSVAAVIFMPATLIASIYGMNFKFMPELDWTLTLGNGWNIPLGYIFAIGLMIFCSALTIWYFKYKKWL